MTENRFYMMVMTVIILVLGYLTYKIISPFLTALMWAVVVTIIFYPLYGLIKKLVKKEALASALTLVIILIIIFGPFSYLSYLISQEAVSAIKNMETSSFDSVNTFIKHPAANSVIKKILSLFNMTEKQFQKTAMDTVAMLGKESTGLVTAGLGNFLSGALNFVFMLLSTFFFLTDGPRFMEKIGSFMPFSNRQRERLFKQTKDVIVSTIYGGITVALAQGLIGGTAFAILGLSSPVLWGFAMFMASFIPLLGTLVVWGPMAVYLLFQGLYLKGTILILVGICVISAVDNIIRPLIIRGKMKMPVLAIFFSILGGIKLFGFIGFIMGPLVLALFVSVFEIIRYGEEERLKAKSE